MTKEDRNIVIDVIEDEDYMLEMIGQILSRAGLSNYKLHGNAKEFFEKLNHKAHIIICDYRLRGSDPNGLEVLKKIMDHNPNCKVIMISVQDSLQIALTLWNHGAFRYVNKRDDGFAEDIPMFVKQAMDEIAKEEAEKEKEALKDQLIKQLQAELQSLRKGTTIVNQ